jgi:mannose-1-phosphate guanylyltransferase
MALADRLVCAVMAGGSGTRFWPLSRQRQPKQLLKFFGDRSLLRATLQRIAPVCPPERQWVITARHLVAAAQTDLPGLQTDHVIGEPVARNTAPCMALAALVAAQLDPAAILVLLPADHWIADEDAFRRALLVAAADADAGHIVTLGIAPSHPETGYGYIETGAAVAEGVHEVVRFVETAATSGTQGCSCCVPTGRWRRSASTCLPCTRPLRPWRPCRVAQRRGSRPSKQALRAVHRCRSTMA